MHAGTGLNGNMVDMNSDFDLLRGTVPSFDSQNNESGFSLNNSRGARLSLCSDFLGGSPSNDASHNGNPSQENGFGRSLPRHSLGVHASATCSAGMLPPVSGGLQSNPFDTGLLHTAQGFPLQGGFSGLSGMDDGNMNMLTCSGVPGTHAQQQASPEGPQAMRTARTLPGTISLPQVPQVPPLLLHCYVILYHNIVVPARIAVLVLRTLASDTFS